MTRRSVKEWIGKTPNSAIPARVKLRVFERFEGRCYLSGRKISAGEVWDADHVIAICNGGENRESNLAPALRKQHRKKTAKDVKEKAKIDRIKKRHLGLVKPSSFGNSNYKKQIDGKVVNRITGEPV